MINAGDPVKAQVVNDAFMSRKVDTSTIGKVQLAKPSGSGPIINDTQKFINQLASTLGTFEGDTSSLDYATNHVVVDGDPYKVAIERIDVYAYDLRQDLDALDAREASNNAAQQVTLNDHEARLVTIESQPSTFGGDKTFSDDVSIQGTLIVNGNTTLSSYNATSGNVTNLNADDLSVTNNASVGNNLSVTNSATIGNDLSVTDDLTVGDKVTANEVQASSGNISTLAVSTLSASGSVSADSLSVTNNGTIGGDLTINGDLFVNGNQTVLNTVQLTTEDKRITLNKNGLASSGGSAGLEVEEGGNITGYAEVTASRQAWAFKAPASAGVIELEPDTTNTTLVINRALFDSKADISSLGALAYKNTVATGDIDDLAVTTTKLADDSVTTAKINDNSVTASKIASNAVDESKIVSSAADGFSILGGSGQKLSVQASVSGYLPSGFRVAGEAIPAGVFACRFGDASLSENESEVYLSDNDFSNNRYQVVMIAKPSASVSAGSPVPISELVSFGLVELSSNVFSASDVGKIIYLGASGALLLSPPTATGTVVFRIGQVINQSSFFFCPQLVGVN